MKKRSLFSIILLMLLPAAGLHSQALFQGLNQPINARGWGMGAATSSQFKGASGMLYNPAVISRAPDLWQLNYTSFPLDIASSSAFAVFHTPLKGKFGLLLNYLDYGSFTERDMDGNETGSFNVNDLTFRLSYGLQLTRRLSIGLASGYSHSQLSSLSARALLGTIGIQYYDDVSTLSVGISYHNFGTLIEGYANDNESLPSTFIIGVSKKLEHLPMIISIDGYQAYPEEYIAKIGGEFIISDHFFLRWGTSTRRFQIRGQETFRNFFASTSIGAGIYFGSFFIDMAFVGLGDAGVISSFSITQHL
jgi:hypothetical protein